MPKQLKDLTAKRRKTERKERIGQILSAARKSFLKKGYHATTMLDICREARLSKGLIYFYFNNKDEIFANIFKECIDTIIRMLKQSIKKDMSPIEKIEAFLDTYVKFYDKHTEKWNVVAIGYKNLNLSEEIYSQLDDLIIVLFDMLHESIADYLQEKRLSKKYDAVVLTTTILNCLGGIAADHNKGYFVNVPKAGKIPVDEQPRLLFSLLKAGLRE
jgi:AcrR family transcriptional regulator